jgi:hypothetical protein
MKIGILVSSMLLASIAIFAGQSVLAQEPTAAPAPAPAASPDLKYSNKWRIEVKEGANNDGVARFRVTPKGEAAIDVTVNIKDGRSENGVARDVKNTFKAALDAKRFHVEGDDGEDVLVKKKDGPDFSIELVESTLKGTHFDLERE